MFGAWRRGSASALGAESRWFKSSRPDHFGVVTVCRDSFFYLSSGRRCSRRSTALKPRKGSDSAKLCAFWSEGACGRPASRRCASRLVRRWRAICATRCRKRRDKCRRQCLPAVFLQRIFCAAWRTPDQAFRKIGAWSAMFFRKPVRIAAEPCDDRAGKRRRRRPLRARKEKIFSGLFFPDANCGRTTGAK